MRACPGVPGVRRAWLQCLIWVVLISAVASSGWAMPRYGRPGSYDVDGTPIGIRAGAIDTQSGRDLLTANQVGNEGPSLSFLYNRGQGSFFPEQRMGLSSAEYTMQAVAAGDFNADGRSDFAVAVDDFSVFPVRGTVLVYLNNGSGFMQPVSYMLNGLFPLCLEAVDVSGDEALDLVVCHSRSVGGGGVEGVITVLEGQRNGETPNGAFQSIYSGIVGSGPAAVGAGDLDVDGRIDLLVADPSEGRVLILYGAPAPARFESPAELGEVEDAAAALVHQVPGQPLPQALVAAPPRDLLTFRQASPRAFAAPIEQPLALLPFDMALADTDDNGLDDLLVVSTQGVDLFYGQADGSFDFGESVTASRDLDALTVADLNGDNLPDVAASASTQDFVTVVLNGADVPFTPAPTSTPTPTGGTPTPTATRTGGSGCPGDCDGGGSVMINELISGVNIALNNAAVGTCPAFDLDGNGSVMINELIAAVNSALQGCTAPAT